MGWNPKKEAEKLAKKAISDVIKPAIESGKRAIDSFVDNAEEEANEAIWKIRKESYAAVKTAKERGVTAIQDAGKEIEQGLVEKLPELIEDAIEELQQAATKEAIQHALNAAADVIELLSPSSFTFKFGIELALVVQGEVTVSFTLPNPIARLTQIRKWAKNPPHGREQIVQCVKDFGPTDFTAEAYISGNGGAMTFDGEEKYDRLNEFLKKHGVD